MQNADLGFLVAFEIDDTRERIDIVVYHAAFADDDQVWHLTYAALDGALGRDGVERWIGVIQVAEREPIDAKPIAYLVEAVNALAATATGEQFALLRGETADGDPVLATMNLALKRVDHPACGWHIAVAIDYAADAKGLPIDDGELATLDDIEDAIEIPVDAIFAGRETGGGRRVLHYVAPAAPDEIRAPRELHVDAVEDPEWDFLRRYD